MPHEEILKDTLQVVDKTFSSKWQITNNEDASNNSAKRNQGQGIWQNQNPSRGRGRSGSIRRGNLRGRGRGRFDKKNVQFYLTTLKENADWKNLKILTMLKKVVSILDITYFYLMPNVKILVKMFGT